MTANNNYNETPPTTKHRIISIIVLMFLFVVLPIGSWYYLKAGFSYRKKALTEMLPKGNINKFSFETPDLDVVTDSLLHNKISIIQFLDKRDLTAENVAMLNKLHNQFDERRDVRIVTFLHVGYNPEFTKDSSQWYVYHLKDLEYNVAKQNIFKIPTEDNVALIDTTLQIRAFYQVNQPESVKKLIAHIAVMLPVVKRKYNSD